MSLSALDLDDHDLADWSALEGVEEIVGWYSSFGYKRQRGEDEAEKVKTREVLDGVKVLDLSHNRLAGESQAAAPTPLFALPCFCANFQTTKTKVHAAHNTH